MLGLVMKQWAVPSAGGVEVDDRGEQVRLNLRRRLSEGFRHWIRLTTTRMYG